MTNHYVGVVPMLHVVPNDCVKGESTSLGGPLPHKTQDFFQNCVRLREIDIYISTQISCYICEWSNLCQQEQAPVYEKNHSPIPASSF